MKIYYDNGQKFTDNDLNNAAIKMIMNIRGHLRGKVYNLDTKEYTYKNDDNHNEKIINILQKLQCETHRDYLEKQRAISILTKD